MTSLISPSTTLILLTPPCRPSPPPETATRLRVSGLLSPTHFLPPTRCFPAIVPRTSRRSSPFRWVMSFRNVYRRVKFIQLKFNYYYLLLLILLHKWFWRVHVVYVNYSVIINAHGFTEASFFNRLIAWLWHHFCMYGHDCLFESLVLPVCH